MVSCITICDWVSEKGPSWVLYHKMVNILCAMYKIYFLQVVKCCLLNGPYSSLVCASYFILCSIHARFSSVLSLD